MRPSRSLRSLRVTVFSVRHSEEGYAGSDGRVSSPPTIPFASANFEFHPARTGSDRLSRQPARLAISEKIAIFVDERFSKPKIGFALFRHNRKRPNKKYANGTAQQMHPDRGCVSCLLYAYGCLVVPRLVNGHGMHLFDFRESARQKTYRENVRVLPISPDRKRPIEISM